MNYHFSIEDCNFYINEEKRIVTCVINDTKYMFMEFVKDFALKYKNSDIFVNANTWKKFEMPARFVGIARCHPDDVFDPSLGKVIAYSRAQKNMYKSFFKRANTYVQLLDDSLDRIVGTFNNMGENISKAADSTDKLIADRLKEAEENSEDFR